MPVEVWQQFLAFPQFTVGIASYPSLWNMSPAFVERAKKQEPKAADDPLEQPGTHEMLKQDADYFDALDETLGLSNVPAGSATGDPTEIPQSMNECTDFITARLEELGLAWEEHIPWLSQQCRSFRDILLLPRLEREKALMSLERHLVFRLMGMIVLVGGNGIFASLYFPSPERMLNDPATSGIPVDFLEDRNPRIKEHFLAREQWTKEFLGE